MLLSDHDRDMKDLYLFDYDNLNLLVSFYEWNLLDRSELLIQEPSTFYFLEGFLRERERAKKVGKRPWALIKVQS